MSAGFTKGPWKVESAGFHDSCEEGEACYFISASGGMHVSTANAHLIAAAPDMYEALERARVALYDSAEALGVPLDTLLAADIERALAKARGEAK